MSVWESTTYKLDIAKEIFENIPDYANSILGRHITDYIQPKGEIVPFDGDDGWYYVADVCDWNIEPMDDSNKKVIGELIQNVTSWSIGVSAVYKLIHACHTDKFEVREQYPYSVLDRRVKAIGTIVGPSSMISPDAFLKLWNTKDETYNRLARKFEDFSEGWKFLARYMGANDNEWEEFDQEGKFGDGNRIYYGGHIGRLIIMVGSAEYSQRGLIMTRNHLNVLIEASARIGCLLDHMSREHANNSLLKRSIYLVLDMTIRDACYSRGFNTDKVVQAYHKARTYMQMQLFSNVMLNTIEEALLEFQKKGLQNVMDLRAYTNCFKGIPRAEWLEIIHVYKWMPPPDYDSSYAFTELYNYHMAPRISGIDTASSNQMKEHWNLIKKERKLNVARAYKNLYSEWPKFLDLVNGSPTEDSLDNWEPSALFPYYTYGPDVTGQIKDKTTVLARMADEINTKERTYDKNFLLWYLRHRNSIDTRTAAASLASWNLQEDNYVRIAYKGEAHKPASRLFFMAPPVQRILLGELEGNLSRIASVYPASLQGMDALRRAEALEKVFDVYDRSYVPETGDAYTCYVITFDLSKFSPRFNPAILKDLHEFWAKVFAYEPIIAMGRIGAYSEILHTTCGLVMSYKNIGADLEGFRGRMMTLFHADLISAACRLSAIRGYTLGSSKTAVFIDDGAVRIAAKGVNEEAVRNALSFLECMREIYEAAGQENHPNKTIVSKIGGELLAEQYLYGQKLKCPIKAGMRLYVSYENPASGITEEFDSLFATVQGSVRDGCTWVIAYRRLAEAYVKAIIRWDRNSVGKVDDIKFAFKVVTPKSIGGFGFPTLQALVSTTAHDITTEGLGILNTAGRAIPPYEEYVERIMERAVIIRDPLHVLRDAGRIRMEGPVLVEGRLVQVIIQKLKEMGGPCAEWIEAYTSEEINKHAEGVALALLNQRSISIPVMKRVWDCTPLAYLEGLIQKFKRSASIKMIIGDAGITRVRRANQRDVSRVSRHAY